MGTKAWLSRYQETERRIDHLIECVRRLASAAQYPTMRLDSPRSSHSTASRQESCIEQMADLQGDLIPLIDTSVDQLREIQAALGTLPWSTRDVMIERYVMGRSWDDVAKTTGLCRRHCMKLHKEGLEALTSFVE